MAFLGAPSAPGRVAVRYDRDDDTSRALGFSGKELQARAASRRTRMFEGCRDMINAPIWDVS